MWHQHHPLVLPDQRSQIRFSSQDTTQEDLQRARILDIQLNIEIITYFTLTYLFLNILVKVLPTKYNIEIVLQDEI